METVELLQERLIRVQTEDALAMEIHKRCILERPLIENEIVKLQKAESEEITKLHDEHVEV